MRLLPVIGACQGCGACLLTCPSHALQAAMPAPVVLAERCTGCGECAEICPVDAISMPADWMAAGTGGARPGRQQGRPGRQRGRPGRQRERPGRQRGGAERVRGRDMTGDDGAAAIGRHIELLGPVIVAAFAAGSAGAAFARRFGGLESRYGTERS